jgi:hypothetical protein
MATHWGLKLLRGARDTRTDDFFSEVCGVFLHHYVVILTEIPRHGRSRFSFCTPLISKTWLSMSEVCPTVCFYVCFHRHLRPMGCLAKTGMDLYRARPAWTLVSLSWRLPALLEILGWVCSEGPRVVTFWLYICQRIWERTFIWSKMIYTNSWADMR